MQVMIKATSTVVIVINYININMWLNLLKLSLMAYFVFPEVLAINIGTTEALCYYIVVIQNIQYK